MVVQKSEVSKESSTTKVYRLLLKISDFFFGSFTELQYTLVLATLVGLSILDTSFLSFFYLWLRTNLAAWIVMISLVVLTIAVIKKRTLSDNAKIGACMLYYGFFAAIACIALQQQNSLIDPATSFEQINIWLTKLVALLSLGRGLITFLIFRLDFEKLNLIVTQNFRDIQYRPIVLLAASSLAIMMVYILQQFYVDLAVIALLAFTYTNIAMMFIALVYKLRIE